MRTKRKPLDWALRDSPKHKDAFIEHAMRCHEGLVHHMARRMPRHLPYEDLIQFGLMGLFTAILKFDPSRGIKFCTMAYPWIRQAMQRGIVSDSKIIRIPTRFWTWRAGYGIEGKFPQAVPFEACHDVQVYEIVSRDRKSDLVHLAETITNERLVARKLQVLEQRERAFIERRFGLNGRPPATLAKIGRDNGITRERVRQILERALEKMRGHE